MVILRRDLHKRSHTVVVIDETGRKLDEKTVAATSEGHLELRRWALRWPDRRWALEDCRHLSRGSRPISWSPASRSCGSRPS